MKKFVADGTLEIVGVTQELHADRCRLFAQWQRFDWPILHDPLNILDLAVVPVVIAIDEHGVVRSTRPDPRTIEKQFLSKTFEAPSGPEGFAGVISIDPERWQTITEQEPIVENYLVLGESQAMAGGNEQLDQSLKSLRAAKALKDGYEGEIAFCIGNVYRMRYESDSPTRKESDFANAVSHWQAALDSNPNQYIWRRRIQQYGPRLMKPYSFYDWIVKAEKEIEKRGDTPVKLRVLPTGAEMANPRNEFQVDVAGAEPDKQSKIDLDSRGLVRLESTTVPESAEPGKSVCIHLTLTLADKSKWNNESKSTRLWVEVSKNARVSRKLIEYPLPGKDESAERRTMTFEVKLHDDVTDDAVVTGYVLYDVCDGDSGQCVFRRQNFTSTIKLRGRGNGK